MNQRLHPFLALSAAAALPLLPACSDAYISGPAEGPLDEEDLYPEFEGATLVVHEPVSAAILLVDEAVPVDAEVLDLNGEPLDFDGIVWTSDQVEGEPIFLGKSGEAELDWGIHAITATADLPNGDRLQYTVGGVRVQGRHTGVYAGNMNITISGEYQGTPIEAACVGGLDFVVDMSGEILEGSGRCTLNLIVIGSFDVDYDLGADVDEDAASGEVSVDFGFFPLGVGWDGEFPEVDHLIGSFEGSVFIGAMTGEIDAHRVSLYVDP